MFWVKDHNHNLQYILVPRYGSNLFLNVNLWDFFLPPFYGPTVQVLILIIKKSNNVIPKLKRNVYPKIQILSSFTPLNAI